MSYGNPSPSEAILLSRIDKLLSEVRAELFVAAGRYPPMQSAHEGYAVLLEEVDELWDEVRVKQSNRDLLAMRKEAIQVAAMAVRFLLDVTGAC